MAWAGYTSTYVANQGIGRKPVAGVSKKLSFVGLARLSRLSWTPESTIGWCTQPANSQLIPQSMTKYLGLARLA